MPGRARSTGGFGEQIELKRPYGVKAAHLFHRRHQGWVGEQGKQLLIEAVGVQVGTVSLDAQQCLATSLQACGAGLGLQLLVDQRQALRIEELLFQPMACPR